MAQRTDDDTSAYYRRSYDAEVPSDDDDRWASRLVGIFFVVLGALNPAGPRPRPIATGRPAPEALVRARRA